MLKWSHVRNLFAGTVGVAIGTYFKPDEKKSWQQCTESETCNVMFVTHKSVIRKQCCRFSGFSTRRSEKSLENEI